MKHGVIQRAATTEVAHLVDDRIDRATASAGPTPPRRGRAVSEAIVSRFVTAFDGIAILVGNTVASFSRNASTGALTQAAPRRCPSGREPSCP